MFTFRKLCYRVLQNITAKMANGANAVCKILRICGNFLTKYTTKLKLYYSNITKLRAFCQYFIHNPTQKSAFN